MNNVWSKRLRPGEKWSGQIGRGKLIRFTAEEAGANVSILLYNMRDTSEKYNMPDTLKAQHTAHLTRGNVLLSDNGRVLASIAADTLGWHDTISGHTTRQSTDRKYGETNYQESGNEWFRSGEENFLVELARNQMGPRDLSPCVNLFSKVFCEEDGKMRFVQNFCPKGAAVTLRTEMDILLVLSNTPHPLDPAAEYPSAAVHMSVSDAPPVTLEDECLNHRPENFRAFENTWEYYQLMGGGGR